MEQNFGLIYQTSFENDSFLQLQKYCTDLISKQPSKVFNSLNFTSIPEKLLVSLIQNVNVQMNVEQVWEHVLKWGIAQNPELPSDPSSYSKDDFNTLKNTLQQCVPFIKFFNFNHKEFLNKVYPYRKILPKDLRENLIKHFIDQPNNQRAEVISSIQDEAKEREKKRYERTISELKAKVDSLSQSKGL